MTWYSCDTTGAGCTEITNQFGFGDHRLLVPTLREQGRRLKARVAVSNG